MVSASTEFFGFGYGLISSNTSVVVTFAKRFVVGHIVTAADLSMRQFRCAEVLVRGFIILILAGKAVSVGCLLPLASAMHSRLRRREFGLVPLEMNLGSVWKWKHALLGMFKIKKRRSLFNLNYLSHCWGVNA